MTTPSPSGCRYCSLGERDHMQRWTTGAGWHQWTPPTDEQIKWRMLARRSNRQETP